MKKLLLLEIIIFMIVSISSSQAQEEKAGSFIDPRDNNTYRWVKIGNQIWMAENLRFKPEKGSWCWENMEENCKTRGRLYNWNAAMHSAPPG